MNNIAGRALLLVFVALAGPLFATSPEYLVGGTVSTPAPNFRAGTSIATDGNDFFVVWSDTRSNWGGDVIGTRVKANGQVVDPLGIRIRSSRSVSGPQVVWDGGAYLVIWTENTSRDARNVLAARIDRDGHVAMPPRVIAENATTTPYSDYAASNGTVTVVAYLSLTVGPQNPARVVVLDRDGNTLHHQNLALDKNSYRKDFAVAANSSRFVVAWSANPGFNMFQTVVEAVALTADGHVIGTPVIVGGGGQPAIGTDGNGFAIVSGQWNQSGVALLSRTVNADLTEKSGERTLISAYALDLPSVLWRGGRYEVVVGRRALWWDGKYDITSIELDRDGHQIALNSRGLLEGQLADAGGATAATSGADVLVAFNAYAPTILRSQIFGRVYRGSSMVADAQSILSWSGNAHANPEIASSASGHFVAWTEESGVYATRVGPQGHSLDGRGVQIAPDYSRARVAFDGTNYVVAWLDSGAFIGVRYIAPLTGATVAEAHVPVPPNGWRGLNLAVSPEATYVLYTDERVRLTRIPHATHIPDAVPLAVSPENMIVADPAASWNGSTLLVTWNEVEFPRVDPPLAIGVTVLGARVTGGLSLLDPAPLTIATQSGIERSSHGAPSVATNGEDWLVVANVNADHVIARRVLSNGTVEGNTPATIAAGFSPAVTWDGARYAVAWRQGNDTPASELMLAAVPAFGALVASRRTLVATQTTPNTPSLARSGDEIAVAYTRSSLLPEHMGLERSYFRVMDFAPKGRVVRR